MKKYNTAISEKELYGEAEVGSSKNRIVYPSFRLSLKQLPTLKDKDFDNKFTVEADLSVKAISKNDKRTEYELEIIKVGIKGGGASDESFDKLSDTEQKEAMKKSMKI